MRTLLFQDLPYIFPILFVLVIGMFMYYPSILVIIVGVIVIMWFVSIFRIEDRESGNISLYVITNIDTTR